jgi:hypothetical protein
MADSKRSADPNHRSSSNHADLQTAWYAVGRRLGELLGKLLLDKAQTNREASGLDGRPKG